MNRTGKTRAAQGPDKRFNEYKDFHQREIEAHMCFIHGNAQNEESEWYVNLNMNDHNNKKSCCIQFFFDATDNFIFLTHFKDEAELSIPTKEVPKQTRGRWFLNLCDEYVETYLECHEVTELAEKVDKLQKSRQSPFKCRSDGCQRTYVHHSGRVKYDAHL